MKGRRKTGRNMRDACNADRENVQKTGKTYKVPTLVAASPFIPSQDGRLPLPNLTSGFRRPIKDRKRNPIIVQPRSELVKLFHLLKSIAPIGECQTTVEDLKILTLHLIAACESRIIRGKEKCTESIRHIVADSEADIFDET